MLNRVNQKFESRKQKKKKKATRKTSFFKKLLCKVIWPIPDQCNACHIIHQVKHVLHRHRFFKVDRRRGQYSGGKCVRH